ncbi:MAG: glycosyltransferase family 2 protein, partial [Gemmobacter sp.]
MADTTPEPPQTAPETMGEAQVLHRAWAPRRAGELRLLDTVTDPGGGVWRAFFGAGAVEADIDTGPHPGSARIAGVRAIGGGLMVTGSGRGAIRTAEGPLAPDPVAADWSVFDGRNVMLAFRMAETPAQIAAWIAWHAAEHAMTGALIVDRAAPGEGQGLAAALRAALAPVAAGGVAVVVLSPGLPLGRPADVAETHPFMAPDAPGKDRMDRPPPDPWLSPLGEGALHEALKWRFLGAARAVLTLDVCDVLPPRADGAPSAFDLCQAARQGALLMAGRRVYPWRVRGRAEAAIGDHICRQFDARRGIARWGVAPAKAGLEHSWRATRVSFVKPDPGAAVPFWRCMALRVPGRATSELAPKTSLVEDPALLALADRLGHKPVRAPVSAPRSGPANPDRTAIVTTMKNEGPFILEWLAYHRAIGVDDFLIYTNDCTDGTDRFLDLLQQKGLVQHRDNPFRSTGLKPQHAALQAAENEPAIREAGWAICMDVDEFIAIKLGDGRLPTLYRAMEAALPGANMIALTWRLFGNADLAEYRDDPLIAQFPLCAPEVVRKPHQAWGFKTLFRNINLYKKLGVHRPKGLRPDLWDQVKWLNGSGRPLPRMMFRNG